MIRLKVDYMGGFEVEAHSIDEVLDILDALIELRYAESEDNSEQLPPFPYED